MGDLGRCESTRLLWATVWEKWDCGPTAVGEEDNFVLFLKVPHSTGRTSKVTSGGKSILDLSSSCALRLCVSVMAHNAF